jgi:hypothetical protein
MFRRGDSPRQARGPGEANSGENPRTSGHRPAAPRPSFFLRAKA